MKEVGDFLMLAGCLVVGLSLGSLPNVGYSSYWEKVDGTVDKLKVRRQEVKCFVIFAIGVLIVAAGVVVGVLG